MTMSTERDKGFWTKAARLLNGAVVVGMQASAARAKMLSAGERHGERHLSGKFVYVPKSTSK